MKVIVGLIRWKAQLAFAVPLKSSILENLARLGQVILADAEAGIMPEGVDRGDAGRRGSGVAPQNFVDDPLIGNRMGQRLAQGFVFEYRSAAVKANGGVPV